jgi:uncharacterized membrane protein YphA (DoxX/SURF4 family)
MASKKLPGIMLHISRLIAGIVFVYSGFVKGIDPLGSAYKFTDYFAAFNLGYLEPFSLTFSILLSSAEMLIGILLISGVHMIIASWAVLIFMVFFTILTFIIALLDPVSDCGCFGDAIILTNWETFWKNLVLLVFVIYLFLNRKRFSLFFGKKLPEWITLGGFIVIILGITAYSYYNLPVFDFRPFSIGANIEEKMSIPPDAPGDEYEITLFYQKDGITRPFRVDSLPDSSWEWVSTESTLINKGYEPPISNFFIESVDTGNDYTYDVLYDQGYTFMLIAYDLNKSSEKNISGFNRLADWSRDNGINFICLTGSPEPVIRNFARRTDASYEFFYSDEITLKTVIRSNPGLVLLKEGTILGKWHHRNIPQPEELKSNLTSWSAEQQQDSKRSLITKGFLLAGLLLLTTLKLIRARITRPDMAVKPDNSEHPGKD